MSGLGDANPGSLFRVFDPIGLFWSLDDGKMMSLEDF